MIAIWPVGPPKLTNPSFNQYQNASVNVTGAGGGDAGATVFLILWTPWQQVSADGRFHQSPALVWPERCANTDYPASCRCPNPAHHPNVINNANIRLYGIVFTY